MPAPGWSASAHLLVLVRLELLCQRRGELRPLNLAAVVGVHRVDDVLHLLLAGVDPSATDDKKYLL